MGTQSTTQPPRRACVPLRIASRILAALPYLSALLLLLALNPSPASAQSTVSATPVPLLLPSAIVFDAQGNLYIAETASHAIRKVDTTGNLTTIAGTRTQGFGGDNGSATAAELDSPQGVAVDANQNLYIADTHNHRIRKINLTTGIVTTIAGTGTAGFSGDNGSPTSAQLNLPTALAVDPAGNLYIADTQNHRIRKINATTGTITTIAGDGTQGFTGDTGPATTASIDSPTGIAVDVAGNLYLADTHNHRIRKITAATGQITTIAGTGAEAYSGDNATATSANLALPHGLTLDATGNLYLADTRNHRIRRIDAVTGIITTIAGDGTQTFAGDNGAATAASLNSPRAVAASPTSPLTVADTGNQRIRQLSPASIQTIIGTGATTISTHSDFTLAAASTASQTIVPGAVATFNFSLATQGTPLSSPIALSASGLPHLATASFNPSYLPPGSASGTFTLTITTPATTAANPTPSAPPVLFAILFLPIAGLTLRLRRHRTSPKLLALLMSIALALCSGCGDRIHTGTVTTPSSTPYTITVTGTATTPTGAILQHFATVVLLMQPAN